MTLRQEVEVHEIHAESDYDEEDDGPVAGAVAVEPFGNLPRPSSHRSVPQHEPCADDYDEDDDGPETGFFVGLHEPFENLPRLHRSEPPDAANKQEFKNDEYIIRT